MFYRSATRRVGCQTTPRLAGGLALVVLALPGGTVAATARSASGVSPAKGGVWTIVEAQSPAGGTSAALEGVSCLSVSDCEAVGSYIDSSGTRESLAEVWSGAAWMV